jgi:hypothetical protein
MRERRKRSLSHSGGRPFLSGDPALSQVLARCLRVNAEAKLPFTHGFHAYPARMHPETARLALESFPGGSVWDPFVGSGTTAVEALRAGRRFVGTDVSQVALEIAWTRTRVWHPERIRAMEQRAFAVAEQAFGEPDVPAPAWVATEREWYDPHTLHEIVILKALVDREEAEVRRLLVCVLSSLVVKLSHQVSDSDPAPDRGHRPRPRHAAYRAFRDKASELTSKLLQLASDLHKRKVPVVEPELRKADAREFVPGTPVDLVLSSPPYAGTYDYAFHHGRRYALIGEDPSFALQKEIGARRAPGGYHADMKLCLGRMLRGLAPGGRIVLQIGDGGEIGVDGLMRDLAGSCGARIPAMASQARRDWSGGPPRREHLILIERPRP